MRAHVRPLRRGVPEERRRAVSPAGDRPAPLVDDPARAPGGPERPQTERDERVPDDAPVEVAGDQTLFAWPNEGRGSLARALDIETLIAVERAALEVVEPVARLWRELAATAERAVTEHTLDTAIRASLSTMSRLLSVNTVAVLLANEAGDELVVRAAIGLSEELTVDIGIHAGEGMAGRVLGSRRPLVVGDLSKIHVVNPVLRNSGLRSIAAVPLMSGGHPLGVMYAASYDIDRFTEADTELLGVVADRLAAALDRVRLFDREREARREAEALAGRLRRIQQATASLAAAHDAQGAARALIAAFEGGHTRWRGVWLADDEDAFRLVCAAGLPPQGAEALAETLDVDGPGALAAALRSGRTEEETYAGGLLVAMPILCDGEAAGVVGMLRAEPLDDAARQLLDAVVGQTGQAIDRARLAHAEHQAAERAGFFARAAQVLAEADDLADTLARLGDLVVSTLGEICLIDVVGEDGGIARMVAKHRDPRLQGQVDRLRTEFAPRAAGTHPAVLAIAEGRASWARQMTDEFLAATTVGPEHFALARALGFRSYLTVPLESAGRVTGAVTCVSTSTEFGRDDMAFAQQLARHVAAVVDNARRYESAFRTSQILQSSLLPARLSGAPGVVVETRYLTANRGLEVGGDFYDVVGLPTGTVLFAVGDVAGHDRGAAAQMGHLRSAARALVGQAPSPSALIEALRESWELLGFERIATVAVGSLDPATGVLRVASAGHYPPLVVGYDGARFVGVVPSPPLGMAAARAPEWEGVLMAGEVLLGYTDGAIDERRAGADASMRRLSYVAGEGAIDPVSVCDRVVAAIAAERADDVALLALAREER